jgi:hypothetical protein
MAEEVRDDIPAQLSEGEYVVPADVVRYYGVKFFEELRGEAKEGLGEMEVDGRIGGEPVGEEMYEEEDDLSPEELEELTNITGMAIGGFVSSRPDPLAATSQYAQGGYVESLPGVTTDYSGVTGYVTPTEAPSAPNYASFIPPVGADPTQVNLDTSKFYPGFSTDTSGIMSATTSAATLYGPNGEVVTFVLPTDQAQYDELIGQGYSTTPPAEPTTPDLSAEYTGQPVEAQRDKSSAPQEDPEAKSARIQAANIKKMEEMIADPLAYGKAQLEGLGSKIGAGLGSKIGRIAGPLGSLAGGALGGLNMANNVADAMTASLLANQLGYDTTELDTQIKTYTNGLSKADAFFVRNAADKAKMNAETILTQMTDPAIGGGIKQSAYKTEEAFTKAMEEAAPAGMAYVPEKKAYERTETASQTAERLGGTKIETTSSGVNVYKPSAATLRPVARPSTPAAIPTTKKDKPSSTIRPKARPTTKKDKPSSTPSAPTTSIRPKARPTTSSSSSSGKSFTEAVKDSWSAVKSWFS